ncbi:hypothetical protein L9G16_21835, partial [Shewanella sp. A25]|nr:hypothetical protein [Shewanella shenzhenensis]
MERMAFRAQTVVADVALAALAFALAYIIALAQPGSIPGLPPSLTFVQLTALYGAVAGVFALLF